MLIRIRNRILAAFRTLQRRLWYFLHRERVTRELEEEMRLHIELRAEWLVAQAASEKCSHRTTANALSVCNDTAYVGASEAARRRFGNKLSIQERSRDMWGFGNFENMSRDIRFASRRLIQRPAFTAAVVGVMAVGIGAATAMFSAVDAALLRPLPFPHPEQLVTVPLARVPFNPGPQPDIKLAPRSFDITDARAMTNVFSGVAAYAAGGLNLGDPENPARLKAGVVTSNFFTTLGVNAYRGRTFVENEGQPGGTNVVVLSHALWQGQFGGRDIQGLRISLSNVSYDVVGVMPPGFSFPKQSDLWIPMSVPTTFATFGAFRNFLPSTVFGRVVEGRTTEWASAQVLERAKIARAAMNEPKHLNIDDMISEAQKLGAARGLQRELVGDRRSALFVLLGATGLLLLIACVNITNLLLSQAALRRRELTLRKVLGATRARIVRQLLTESLLLSVAGAVLGVILAPLALRVMTALLPASLAGVASTGIDLRVLGFATALALLTGLAFGVLPALGASGNSDSEVIKSGGGHGATAAKSGRARRLLVSAELALTVTLLVGAGLMLRSFAEMLSRDSGMQTSQVATLELAVPKNNPNGKAETLRHLDAILSRLESVPGVVSAGVVNDLPLSGAGGIGLTIDVDGVPKVKGDGMQFARYLMASGGYFKAMGIPLLRGRVFTSSDDSIAPGVVVISNTLARKYFPNSDPLGRTMRFSGDKHTLTIIGVVADVRESKLETDPGMQMYLSVHADTPNALAIVARGNLPDRALLAQLTDAVRAVDRSQAVYNVRMMNDVVSVSTAPRRTNTILISAFAGIALMLAAVGVYAVVSHGVAQRTRELGIRSALGASGSDLLRLISQDMVLVTAGGIAFGLLCAWMLARTLSSLVYGVDVHDKVTFAIVPIALLIPTVIATLLPARRAARVNPADVMRAD